MPSPPLLLVLDAGSPLVSVAIGRGGEVIASRSVEISRSSTQLLEMISEVLGAAGARPRDLGGVAALRGPGSFTGLRIGLATVLGLHQALGVPATALSTLQALAAEAAAAAPLGTTVVAAVDALRGDWSAQAFTAAPLPRELGGMALVPAGELPRLAGAGPALLAGFGVSQLADQPGWPGDVLLHDPGELAPAALRLLARPETVWDPGLLISPIYSRPPAVTLPKARPREDPAPAALPRPA
jgi:tRNA threonylcarbamoyl adenosine modification protein YeaZ